MQNLVILWAWAKIWADLPWNGEGWLGRQREEELEDEEEGEVAAGDGHGEQGGHWPRGHQKLEYNNELAFITLL